MSDETPPPGTPDDPRTADTGPRPEPLRFYGTTWVDHTGHYALRRAGLAAGSLLAAVAACLVLRFAFEGMQIAEVGGLVNTLLVVFFAVCSAIAFRRTWEGFTRRLDPSAEQSLRSVKTIGFIGSLLAYFFRSLAEAPGEKLHRTEYETARARYERRSTRRAGNPAKRKRRR
ncbi:EamA/RhaT family transporter [Streptomyces sp. NPDC060194]|uniref:EamA/RhaT family transporter n=1 Tax=Streptomyces sp. NPDC060194 TaxID=3347069 RepID=UPI00365C7C70